MARRYNADIRSVDRRGHFRIDDEVFLEYRVIQKKQVQDFLAGIQGQAPSQHSLVVEINELSVQTRSQLKAIKRSYPLIGRYLSALDDKINLIARHISAFDSHSGRPNRRVNISAGGIAFHSQLQFPPETPLAISLKLFPSHREILTYGAVVYCRFEPDVEPGEPHRIAVSFNYMREPDREALISHILDKQFASARAQRQAWAN